MRTVCRSTVDFPSRVFPQVCVKPRRLAYHALWGELPEKAVHYLRQAGLKASARSALPDARVWFKHALAVLNALPESQSTLAQAFEIRPELRLVLYLLGEVQPTRERLREAEAIAERLNDERRRGCVCAFMTNIHSRLGELDEALLTGTRALAIARARGDLRLASLPRPISSRRATCGVTTSG